MEIFYTVYLNFISLDTMQLTDIDLLTRLWVELAMVFWQRTRRFTDWRPLPYTMPAKSIFASYGSDV